MNSQVSPKTGYSPSELFLGRPSWKMEVTPEPESSPSVESFLREQMNLQEVAMKRLQKLRKTENKMRNKGRVTPSYYVGDYVLVHHSRWPQRKLKKIESPWFGPYQILEVRHNSLKVAVSPTLGGEAIVSLSHVKHWKEISEHDEEFSDEEIFEPDEKEEMDEKEDDTKEEEYPQGFFKVSKILEHKYHQGWKFLTQWEGYPISASTWEPPSHFVTPKGEVNEMFSEYCQSKKLCRLFPKIFGKEREGMNAIFPFPALSSRSDTHTFGIEERPKHFSTSVAAMRENSTTRGKELGEWRETPLEERNCVPNAAVSLH